MLNIAIMRPTPNAQRPTHISLPVNTDNHLDYNISCERDLAGFFVAFLCLSLNGRTSHA